MFIYLIKLIAVENIVLIQMWKVSTSWKCILTKYMQQKEASKDTDVRSKLKRESEREREIELLGERYSETVVQ